MEILLENRHILHYTGHDSHSIISMTRPKGGVPLTQYSAYSGMSPDRTDYEPCYRFSGRQPIYGLHCHDFYEFYVHYRGGLYYFANDSVMPMRNNQLIIMPPFHMHGLFGETTLIDYERAYLYITPTMLSTLGGQHIDLTRFFAAKTDKGQYQFEISDRDAAAFKKLVIEMEENLREPSPVTQFSNYASLVRCMDIMVQAAQTSREIIVPPVAHDAILEVVLYINEHFTTPIRLEDLARRFGVSVSFLSHGFVRYTGKSVYSYVLYRRVQMAKEMIYSEMPLNDIAYQCGFNDYSSFMRSFNKIAGMSPHNYRKQVKRK